MIWQEARAAANTKQCVPGLQVHCVTAARGDPVTILTGRPSKMHFSVVQIILSYSYHGLNLKYLLYTRVPIIAKSAK
jgi:hypothetical protein